MNLLRKDIAQPSAQDLLALWAGIMVAAFAACVCILFGWSFDYVTGLVGELRRGRR